MRSHPTGRCRAGSRRAGSRRVALGRAARRGWGSSRAKFAVGMDGERLRMDDSGGASPAWKVEVGEVRVRNRRGDIRKGTSAGG